MRLSEGGPTSVSSEIPKILEMGSRESCPFRLLILVSFSPTIVCTFLLLGTLLTYGQPSVPEMEEEEETTDDLSLLQVGSTSNELVVQKPKKISMVSHTETRGNVKGIPLKESNIIEQDDHVCKVESRMLLSASNKEEERKGGSVGTCSLLEQDENQIQFDKKATDNREVKGKALSEKSESLEEYLVRDAQQVVHPVTSREKETKNLKVEMHKPMMERGLNSSLDLSKKLVCSNDVSNSDSDHTGTHPPDGSFTDNTWMIKELHPIIDCGAPQLVSISVDDSHSVPRSYGQNCRCDGNMEEKAEHMEGSQKEKNGESAIPATCTADEDMNHMDLSSSILVRTKRLKSLILKRRARKNLRAEAEKSLRGLDINKTAAMLDELKHIQLRIPLVSRGRNPFDLPSYSEDELDLPGSAPSAFLPRGNIFDEFDLPFDQEDEKNLLTDVNVGCQRPTSLPQKDTFFRRYESFTVGASFTGEPRQEKHDIKLMPDPGTGSTILEEPSYADFQRQLSDESLSKTVSVPASESNSLVVDRNYDDPVEQELNQESLAKLIFPCDDTHVRNESSLSDEVDLLESPGREKEIGIYDIDTVGVNTPTDFEEETHETFDDFVEYEKKVRYEMELHSPTSDTANSDLAEVKYMESSSTSSLEVSKNISIMPEEKSTDLQQSIGDHLKGSHSSVDPSTREGETLNDFLVDFSPSVTSRSSLNTASFGSNITLSTASETQTESSDLCLPEVEEKNNVLCIGHLASGKGNRGETHMSDNGALWVLPSNLSSVEKR
ncbi:hypothetical protein Taro_051189 [Colocasia esculenta]|uniref:Uncharacterized protein n=1 Tax=Colocasia esculenta TaxID=4460 RepID=A0A843XG47_COLES|nr:hypothetical protein [Colocasia esculenta]